jgi:transcription elongation factor GreA
MSIREALPPVLRGETAATLTATAVSDLDALAERADGERMLAFVRDECAARMRQPHPSHGVAFLMAEVCRRNGEIERSHQTLLALGDGLARAADWEALALIAERALAVEETQAAVRLLVTAYEHLNREPEYTESLQRAWAMIPEDLEIGLQLAVRLGAGGRAQERRTLLAELMPRFASEKRYAGLEEAALEFSEHQDTDGLLRLVETLPVLIEQGATGELNQLLDIGFGPIAAAGRAGEALPALRLVVAKVAERLGPAAADRLRDLVIEALRQGPARELPDADAVLAASGITDTARPFLQSLERFDAIASLPPGRAVHHSSFGAGRVVANDAETVRVDFAHSRGHAMPIAAARRTLTAIDEDDLRLVAASEPGAISKLEPGEILVRGLRALGGEGDATRLKVFLVGSQIIPVKDWTSFWRRGRAALEKDARVDASRAFEQRYRLAPQGEVTDAGGPLPALEVRKPARTNLATLKKFLAQHPGADAALAQRFGRYLMRVMLDSDAELTDRARAGLHVARWDPDRLETWASVLRELWERGLSVADLSGEDEQMGLLHSSHAAGVESDAILSALDSRFASVRAEAEGLLEHLDDRGRDALRATLLAHAVRYPGAALRRIEEELGASPRGMEGWRLLVAALGLIEERPKPSVAEKVLRWLEPDGAFERVLRVHPPDEDHRLRVRVLLRQWRSSDRFLFPALELVERLGLVEEADTVRAARDQRSARLFEGVGQIAEDADLVVMTRATFERLRSELEILERELRTTIPQTIRKARELGDLRENAEFHSAKLKQANVSKLVASLQKRLARARFVDDVDAKEGVAGLGTEVVLEGDTDVATYWILGEDEHHHGENVISFQAPVGRALVGRSIGDTVELGEPGNVRRYRIVSVARKLPEHAPPAEETKDAD